MISLCLMSSSSSPNSLTFSLSLFNSSGDNQSNVECETVSLDESKKFKIININQATSLDGPGNKFERKAQLIEIDKLLINTPNGPKQNSASGLGVWHQVSSLSFAFSLFLFDKSFAFFPSHLMNVAALLLRSKHAQSCGKTFSLMLMPRLPLWR